MSFRGIFVRLRAYFVEDSTPQKTKNLNTQFNLQNVKRCKYVQITMFYCMDANKMDLTYILFYNVFIIKIIVSKVTSKV